MAEILEAKGQSRTPKVNDKKVILVEDEKSPLSSIRETLKKKGFEVASCSGSFEALDELCSQGADAVVAATKLGDLSGYQLSCLIKSTHLSHGLPVVLVANDDTSLEGSFWHQAAQADSVVPMADLKSNNDKVVAALSDLLGKAKEQGWNRSSLKGKGVVPGVFSGSNLVSSYNSLLEELLVERLVGNFARSIMQVIEPRKRFVDNYLMQITRLLDCSVYGFIMASSSEPWGAYHVAPGISAKSFTDMVKKASRQLDLHKDLVMDVRGELLEESGSAVNAPEVLPISGDKGVLGALVFAPHHKKGFDPISKSMMAHLQLALQPIMRLLLAQQEIQSLHQQEQYRQSTDPLTGLYNLEFVVGFLQQQLLFSFRQKSPVGLIIIDIDRLKRINDEYGYEIGDLVLSTIGHKLLNQTRGSDLIGRYGGDEILVILPNTDIEGTKVVAEKTRLEIEQMSFVKGKGSGRKGPHVTVSIGCAVFNMEDLNPETILVDAKQALHRAKTSGGNRVSS